MVFWKWQNYMKIRSKRSRNAPFSEHVANVNQLFWVIVPVHCVNNISEIGSYEISKKKTLQMQHGHSLHLFASSTVYFSLLTVTTSFFFLRQVSLPKVYSLLDRIYRTESTRTLRNPSVYWSQLWRRLEGSVEDVGLEELTIQRAVQWCLACQWVGWCHSNLLTTLTARRVCLLSLKLSSCNFLFPGGIEVHSSIPFSFFLFLFFNRCFFSPSCEGEWVNATEEKLKEKLPKRNREGILQ